MTDLKIASFNILAPAWSHPKWYNQNFLSQLDPSYRRPRIRAQISALAKEGVEVFLLQETQPSEIADLFSENGLNQNQWYVYQVAHAANYWQKWWIVDPAELAIAPWTADHTNHGVTILAKKSSFSNVMFSQISASTGNAQAKMTATYQGLPITIICIHYDSDSATNRQIELEASLAALPVGEAAIIGGDFNIDTNSGNLQSRIKNNGFVDLFYNLNIAKPTHPFSSQYYSSFNWSIIDHFIIRGFLPSLPSLVIDHNLYDLYPTNPPPDQEYDRISANFKLVGSDHFPLLATLQ